MYFDNNSYNLQNKSFPDRQKTFFTNLYCENGKEDPRLKFNLQGELKKFIKE